MQEIEKSTQPRPTLVVLAAGIGSRYGGLKQIDPIGPSGELIIDYSVYDALQAGFGAVVFVVSESILSAFRERVGQTIETRCDTSYVLQRIEDVPHGFRVPPARQKPWGTAHATRSCRNVVRTPFAVINADDFYGHSAFQTLCNRLQSAQDRDGVYDYCLVGYHLQDTLSEHGHVARGICTVDPDGYLGEIHERTQIRQFGSVAKYTEDGEHWIEIPGETTVSMNMWGFTPSLFAELEARFVTFLQEGRRHDIHTAEFFLPEVVGDLVKENRASVQVLPTRERWFGVTYPQDRSRVRHSILDLVRQGLYPADLWRGTRQSRPSQK
jgi:NDP-sugar pyrophosphorylase family protein